MVMKTRTMCVCILTITLFQTLSILVIWNSPVDLEKLCTKQKTHDYDLQKELQMEYRNLDIGKDECFLFAMILSTGTGKSRRNAIRHTWMKDSLSLAPKVTVKFIIGTLTLTTQQLQLLEAEQKDFNDLILLNNLKDSFTNLTRKVLWSFVHIDKSYSFKYLFKGDDDTFVQLVTLVGELSQRKSHTRYYWGFFDGRSRPKRQGKYIETDWFVCDLYVPYALGGGYILSHDLVSRITVNADGLKLYNAEDISVGLWLSGFEMERRHDVRFDTEYKSRGCQNVYLVSHKQTEDMMRDKYKNMNTIGRQCIEETQLRKSYEYNWKVPPSQCCERQMGIP